MLPDVNAQRAANFYTAAKKSANTDVTSFIADLNLQHRLDIREAFYGGRTNTIQLYH